MVTTMVDNGDNVLISPDLTGFTQWIEGVLIEVENTFGKAKNKPKILEIDK